MLQSLRSSCRRIAPIVVLALCTVSWPLTAAAQPPDISTLKNPFPKMPEGVTGMFSLRDSRALDALQYMRCMNTTVVAGQRGVLGVIPDKAILVCMKEKDEWRGVFGLLDAERKEFRVIAQFALRGDGARTNEPLDTAKAAAVARGMLRGFDAPTRGAPKYSFTPIPLQLGTFVEVWFLPVQNNASIIYVGGDSLIQMTADGRREQGHFSKSPPVRELPMPSGAKFVIDSNEEEVPLVSELVAARLALLRVPEVRVRTKKFESVLSNATRKWAHTPRRS
jgi:hypothetical protein